jgi:hypothetical protein
MAGCSSDQMRFRLENMSWQVERKSSFSIAIHYLQIALAVVGLACCTFVVLFLADQVSVLATVSNTLKFSFRNENSPKHASLSSRQRSGYLFTRLSLSYSWQPICLCGIH